MWNTQELTKHLGGGLVPTCFGMAEISVIRKILGEFSIKFLATSKLSEYSAHLISQLLDHFSSEI